MAATPAEDAVDVALRVAAAIELVGGSYFVGGSLASSLQGEPRATNDVDIVLSMPLERISNFVRALGADFEVDVDMLRDALLHGQRYSASSYGTAPADLFQNDSGAMWSRSFA